MISRRTFLQQVGVGMAASMVKWSLAADPVWGWPAPDDSERPVRLALLADGHLRLGPEGRTAADNLQAAVNDINAMHPPIDLVFYLGDLTAEPDLRALALGKKILGALSAPCWLIPGENDPATDSMAGSPASHGGLFAFTWRGVHFCGLDTRSGRTLGSEPQFCLTLPRRRWLAAAIKGLPPEVPLVLLTHAPLYALYQPWQWWTAGTESLPSLLGHRRQVLLFHGHVHQHIGVQMGNLIFQGVRSTAWSLPDVHIGTTAAPPSPQGQEGRAGCGWLLLSISCHRAPSMLDRCWTA